MRPNNMTVYVLVAHYYEDYEILGVFASREMAEAKRNAIAHTKTGSWGETIYLNDEDMWLEINETTLTEEVSV